MFDIIKNTFTKVKAALINDGTGVKDRVYPKGKRERLISIYTEKEQTEKSEAERLKEAEDRTKTLETLLAEKQQKAGQTPVGFIELENDDYPFIVEETKFENKEKLKYLRTVDESMGKRIEEIAKEN